MITILRTFIQLVILLNAVYFVRNFIYSPFSWICMNKTDKSIIMSLWLKHSCRKTFSSFCNKCFKKSYLEKVRFSKDKIVTQKWLQEKSFSFWMIKIFFKKIRLSNAVFIILYFKAKEGFKYQVRTLANIEFRVEKTIIWQVITN